MNIPSLPAACLAIAMLASPAFSQGAASCKPGETIADCWTRMRDGYVADIMNAKPKGQPTVMLDPALGKSMKDFLPRFASGFSTPTDKKNIGALQYNTLPISTPIGRGRLQLTGTLRSPEPYKALIDTVAKAQRAAATKEITDELRDIDDIEVSLGWNVETPHFGRSFSSQRRLLSAILKPSGLTSGATLRLSPLYREFGNNRKPNSKCTKPAEVTEWTVACATDSFRDRIDTTVSGSASTAAREEAAVRAELDSSGIFTVPFLINNQPQLHFNLGYRHSDKFVGPRQAYAEMTYEFGQYNMESLRHDCNAIDDNSAVTAKCLRDYVRRRDVRDGLRSSNRFSLTVGATRYLEYDAQLASYNASLVEPASWQWRAKAAWGRYLGVPDEGTGSARGRFETSFEYVNHTNDAFRAKNRVLGSVSYTHRVNDDVSLTTGFVAANKSEVRGDVDWPIGARAGFKYKVGGGDSK